MIRCALSIFALSLLLAACAQTIVPVPKSGQAYFDEGETFFAEENYADAIASWERVRDSFQSPELTAIANYRIAEAHFLNQDYLEASISFEEFIKQYPDHPQHAEALYYLGVSYFNQILSRDRDQLATENARLTLSSFIGRYPNDKRVAQAREMIDACTTRLAEHELYVGNFYLRTKAFAAAVKRLSPIPYTYPGFPDLDLVYLYLGQAHLRNGSRPQAVEAFNTLYRLFPDSKAVEKARKTLAEEY